MSNSNSVLKCRVRKSGSGFEGTVFVPGMKPTKLCKRDETSVYANASGVTSAAKSLAERLGLTLEVEDNAKDNARPKKMAVATAETF